MNELKELNIENMIYEIRGKQVMLDSDLAKLYQCKNGTKTINQSVNRHLDRFPSDFRFQLKKEELSFLWSQAGTAKYTHMSRTMPYVYTEEGVAMLASILRTEIASKMSVNIMRAFVKMRQYIKDNFIEQKFINNMVLEHDNSIKLLNEAFDKLEEKKKVNEIYFNGEIYDAYSKVLDIFNETKEELIIIDGYADKKILDMIRNLKVTVILITSKKGKLTSLDIEKYNKQYHNLKVIYDNTFHDRYFIIDRNTFYHSGTSINYIGLKTFSINILEDKIVKESLLNKIKKIL